VAQAGIKANSGEVRIGSQETSGSGFASLERKAWIPSPDRTDRDTGCTRIDSQTLGPAGEHAGSGSAYLLTPFEVFSPMNRIRLAELLPFSFQSSPFSSSVGAFSLLIRVEVAREQSVPPCLVGEKFLTVSVISNLLTDTWSIKYS